ncbi:hypothetical protein PFICI_14798 [Pestalotiopsis fici W106-1]|uniref:Zn(2)-C6 fungal-type domain-containing protein n=1 Tax=Pestalotiopsis fici (strain W106-1 / CGMCC3.15140) TaxID=1229662 RepID=W3WL23_PESFW|nr:uncharacterized protein PFICI_14798 [Pestalotiopsis fici W106-1]ETS73852.1 hypothetical protein PFICI_14798 [Pestalotiopsis fici W106-1]
MPGRKRADGTGPIRRRARTGCKSCRERKIKCDETKPVCRNCSSRGLTCHSGLQLKWHEEFATRGVAFGRQGVWTKDSGSRGSASNPLRTTSNEGKWLSVPEIKSHHFVHADLTDFEPGSSEIVSPHMLVEPDQNATTLSALSSCIIVPPIPRQLAPLSTSIDFDSGLFEYYLRKLCPLTTTSRTASSPFAQLIPALLAHAGQDDVLQSLLAFSARHRSLADPRWNQKAMSLKGGVLASLQKRLSVSDTASLRHMFPQVLITMMFLCLYEIIGKCDHRWVIHLEASQDIIRIGRARGLTQPHDNTYGLAAFAERFFAFQDSISVIACGKAPLFGADYWDNMANKRHVDSWMGCSPELAGILCDITEMGRAKTAGKMHAIELFEHADAMEARIHSLESITQVPNDDELIWSAELKRLSALIYLHCVLYDATPSTPVVSQLVRQILEQVLRMLRAGRARALAFPVFVTAVELDPTDEIVLRHAESGESIHGRRLILETLEAMSTDSLSNVTRIRAVVKKVWKLRDMNMGDKSGASRTEPPSPGQGNDWATFVGPNSLYISLA